MLHLKTARATSIRSDIEDRLTGRFYTPLSIAEELVRSVPAIGCPESICDPFCGDGRLVLAWLRHLRAHCGLRRLRKISLWDFDAEAVERAKVAIQNELAAGSATWVTIDSQVGDTFSADLVDKFDIVITNPPWEQLKPDARDGVKDSDRYRAEIQSYASRLGELFAGAATCRKRSIGGYTVNLARAGALLAAHITKPNGLLQIVLPSSILGDQVSSTFRENFFGCVCVNDIDVYPAEAKLFSGVDQPFVTVTGRGGQCSSRFLIRRFNADLSVSDEREHSHPSLGAPLPLAIGGTQNDLVQWLRKQHPESSWLESDLRYGLKLGRELDETRIGEAFTTTPGGVPFVKGRNITRYGHLGPGLPSIDPDKRRIPPSVQDRRVAWRDVSRPSQKRRVHASIIPAGFVTGNSLGIARFNSPQAHLLETLLAVMNSFVFEIQVRGSLSTNHVSQGILRQCVIPYALFEDATRRAEVACLATDATEAAQTQLEIRIAKAYGLSRGQFATMLKGFEKVTENEVEMLLDGNEWR